MTKDASTIDTEIKKTSLIQQIAKNNSADERNKALEKLKE